MTQNRQDIGLAVAEAQRDSEAADAFVRQYMGFIRSETVKFIHTAPENGHEDELSIAMLAFYEAILGYQKTKGPFLAYAARSIRNRLIDYYRREKRRGNTISLYTPDTEDRELADTLADEKDQLQAHVLRQASREEIREFGEKLAAFHYSYGNFVKLDHGQDAGGHSWTTLYGHMDDLAVQPGQVVKTGDLLGHVGSTGNAVGNHLHFEIYKSGVRVSAYNYFPYK